TREDLEELAVPTAGLARDGTRRVAVGDHVAVLAVVADSAGTRSELGWLRPNGKPQASVPAAIKHTHGDAIRALKHDRDQLDALLEAQVLRLGRLWLDDRRLPVRALIDRYLEHPVVGQVGRRLVWRIDRPGGPVDVLWHGGRLAAPGGAPIDIGDLGD